jgi:hypothetical protein
MRLVGGGDEGDGGDGAFASPDMATDRGAAATGLYYKKASVDKQQWYYSPLHSRSRRGTRTRRRNTLPVNQQSSQSSSLRTPQRVVQRQEPVPLAGGQSTDADMPPSPDPSPFYEEVVLARR